MTTDHPFEESTCIARAQRGDRAAFSELVTQYQDRIFRFLLRLTRSQDDALDLTQETFIHAWMALERWRPQARFTTWLFQIARNQAIDLMRRTHKTEFVAWDDDAATTIADPGPGPDAALHNRQRLRALDQALLRLPLDQREVLLLREIEDMSYEDIAAVLDLNLGTVKSRIARARAALLDHMPP